MDRLLSAYAVDPGSAAETGKKLRAALVLGGHPVGFFMVTAVLDAFGRERVVANVGDPFTFVADYSAAAAQLGGAHHVFSLAALAGVRRLAASHRRAERVGLR